MVKKEKKAKVKGTLKFRDYIATTLMSLTDAVCAGFMTSYFMVYLTDYSGIAGAAAIGTTVLFAMRLFDAVNDPIEAWIVDKAKVGKFGKYKPFIILSIVCEAIGVSLMFNVPESVASHSVIAVIWVIVAYLFYDIGGSLYLPNLVYRTISLDANERGKLMIAPRTMNMVVGMITGSLISIISSVNESMNLNSLHNAFGVTVLIFEGAVIVMALLGAFLINEKHHPKEDEEKNEVVKITDIVRLFKENDALRTRSFATLFSGFIWTFMFATISYYIKYAYCVDLNTGEFNTAAYGTYFLIASMMQLFPLLIGTFIATPIMRKFKTVVSAYKFGLLLEGVPLGIMFVLQLLGILRTQPIIYLTLLGIAAVGIGYNFIPGETINIECMDYELYKNGKDRSALCNATSKFIDKMQNAFSTGFVGLVLIMVGYQVNPATGDYIGSLASIPTMNNWLIVISGLIPFAFAIIAVLIYKKYPITPEIYADMKEKLAQREVQ